MAIFLFSQVPLPDLSLKISIASNEHAEQIEENYKDGIQQRGRRGAFAPGMAMNRIRQYFVKENEDEVFEEPRRKKRRLLCCP